MNYYNLIFNKMMKKYKNNSLYQNLTKLYKFAERKLMQFSYNFKKVILNKFHKIKICKIKFPNLCLEFYIIFSII